MIITIGNTKGGVGKTTIACNLAVCSSLSNRKVLLIDADVQGSSMAFRASRSTDDIKAMAITTPTLHSDLNSFREIDLIFVDAGGRDNKTFRSAIMASDLLVIPCMASQVDFWAVGDVVDLLKEARIYKPEIRAFFLLNQVNPVTTLSRDAVEAMNDFDPDVKPLDTIINARIAYKKSFGEGKGVVEWNDPKAKKEISDLFNEILSIVEVKKHDLKNKKTAKSPGLHRQSKGGRSRPRSRHER